MIVIFAGGALVLIRNNQKSLTENLISQAKSFSQLSVRPFVEAYELYFSSGYLKFKEITEKILALNPDISRIQLIDVKGNILVDSKYFKAGQLSQQYSAPVEELPQELKSLLKSPEPIYISDPQHKERISEIFYPYFDDWGIHSYTARYFVSYERVDKEINRIKKQIMLLSIIALVFTAFLMGKGVDKLVVMPIKKFQEGVQKISGGNLERKIDIKTGDEIESLAKEFNLMIERLKKSKQEVEEARNVLEIKVRARTRELAELNQELERKVKERTKNLLKKLEELQEYQQVAMGRDLKMAEFRREIKRLKEENERLKKLRNPSE